jgi:hypothetical protein
MKKLVVVALIFILAALIIMMFFNKPLLSLAVGGLGFIFIFIAAAKHESNIEDMYRDSNVLMCSEGVIRHIKLHK